MERLIETIKDRIRVFDKYFPWRCSKPELGRTSRLSLRKNRVRAILQLSEVVKSQA